MFLIRDNENNRDVFTESDPQDDGFKGQVSSNVDLEVPSNLTDWPDGTRRPLPVLGILPTDATHYKVFKYSTEAESAGFQVIGPQPVVASSYAAYLRVIHSSIPYNIKTYLSGVWNSVELTILRNGDIEAPSPSYKRRLLREYMDGEPITNDNARQFWRPLTDHQKTLHLFHVFPDEPTFVE